MADDIANLLRARLWTASLEYGELLTRAADRIDRLHAQVTELLPFLIADVDAGLALGAPPADHPDDDCQDCAWYRESVAWKARLDTGEFGPIPNAD